MASLHELPNEILVEIFSNLPATDLANTSRLSQRLHDVSEPLLYKAPSLATDFVDCYGTYSLPFPDPTPSLELFLRTLITPGRGFLATHVRSLTLVWNHHHAFQSGDGRCHPLDDISLRTLSPSLLLLPSQSQSTQAYLLLLRLSHLRTLHISIPHVRHTFQLFMNFYFTLPLPTGHPPLLHTLREFRISAPLPSGISYRCTMQLMALPSLHTINTSVNDFDKFDNELDPPPVASSAVTKLLLNHSNISGKMLIGTLLVPRALTYFSYSNTREFRPTFIGFNVALQPLRASLVSLYLHFTDLHRQRNKAADPVIESLREWPMLRTVGCQLLALVGRDPRRLVDVLPPGIRELEVMPDSHFSVEASVGMLMGLVEGAQSLEMMAVEMEIGTERERLSVACAEGGIRLIELQKRD